MIIVNEVWEENEMFTIPEFNEDFEPEDATAETFDLEDFSLSTREFGFGLKQQTNIKAQHLENDKLLCNNQIFEKRKSEGVKQDTLSSNTFKDSMLYEKLNYNTKSTLKAGTGLNLVRPQDLENNRATSRTIIDNLLFEAQNFMVPKQTDSLTLTNDVQEYHKKSSSSQKIPTSAASKKLASRSAPIQTANKEIAYAQSEDLSLPKECLKPIKRIPWTKEEDECLHRAVDLYNGNNWKAIADMVPNRTHIQCLQRWRKSLNPSVVKGRWTPEEDNMLLQIFKDKPHIKNWGHVARAVPGRTAKQCRERYTNHLDPKIKKGGWTPEEDHFIMEGHKRLGNKWSEIASHLPGRTENSVKTRTKCIKRRIQKENRLRLKRAAKKLHVKLESSSTETA